MTTRSACAARRAWAKGRRWLECLPCWPAPWSARSNSTQRVFNGGAGRVHTKVRQRMRDIYERKAPAPFLDAIGNRFVSEGQDAYAQLELNQRLLLDQGNTALVLTWLGESANEALACIMMARGFKAATGRLGVEITKSDKTLDEIEDVLADTALDRLPPA